MQIQIDPEFQSLIPPLTADERQQLEANVLADGCRDPLVVWRGLLLDGHNRFAICQTHGLHYETHEIELPDRAAAADWVDANQLGRRNLTPDQVFWLVGRRYERTKKATPNPDGVNQHIEVDGQTVHQPTTAERLGAQHGMSERTVRRAGDFAAAVESLKPSVPDIEARVMRGDVPSRSAVELAEVAA